MLHVEEEEPHANVVPRDSGGSGVVAPPELLVPELAGLLADSDDAGSGLPDTVNPQARNAVPTIAMLAAMTTADVELAGRVPTLVSLPRIRFGGSENMTGHSICQA